MGLEAGGRGGTKEKEEEEEEFFKKETFSLNWKWYAISCFLASFFVI